jgi:Flp pilus assembly protein TadD
MRLSLRQALLGIAFLIVYGTVVFVATRAYYQAPRPAASATPAAVVPAQTPRPFATTQLPSVPLADDPLALADQADELFRQKRYAQAIAAYRKLLTLVPDDAETYNDLGLALHYAGQSAEGLQVLEQGAAKDSDFQRIWLTLGFVRLQLGRVDEARAAFETCLELDPGSAIADEARRFLDRIS